ncbi:MAG: hypothetical protein HeimC2_32980 [Candidatus Heimdallarchaeota archaeon LC_2]|nr:MAG: hypothetical protein HeimC2_32980 [Candidatus Heimdallarchaeota archaeon LC_2]
MMFEKEKVEEHYKSCKIKNAQECKICKPYVNGIIEATKEMIE